jgi:hypothetical protein
MGGGHVILIVVLRSRLVSFRRSFVVLGSFVVFVFGHKMYSPAELDRRGSTIGDHAGAVHLPDRLL